MVDEKQLILQTQVAVLEKHEARKALGLSRYDKFDYISFQMFRTGVFITLGFLVGFGWYCVYHFDQLTREFDLPMYLGIGRNAAIIYLILLGVFEVASFIFFVNKYQKDNAKCREYRSLLRKLRKIYDKNRQEEGK